uniref:Uncharacterized protein n=1 Tax=Cacopsylla melanoneura TaxID=428564 RepID=A0A8D8WUT8_9HEMI
MYKKVVCVIAQACFLIQPVCMPLVGMAILLGLASKISWIFLVSNLVRSTPPILHKIDLTTPYFLICNQLFDYVDNVQTPNIFIVSCTPVKNICHYCFYFSLLRMFGFVCKNKMAKKP